MGTVKLDDVAKDSVTDRLDATEQAKHNHKNWYVLGGTNICVPYKCKYQLEY